MNNVFRRVEFVRIIAAMSTNGGGNSFANTYAPCASTFRPVPQKKRTKIMLELKAK